MDTTDVIFIGIFVSMLIATFFFKVGPCILFIVSFISLFLSGLLTIMKESQWSNFFAVAGFIILLVSIVGQMRYGNKTFDE